ncbi:MAG: dipeptidase [Rhodothermales bacterium]
MTSRNLLYRSFLLLALLLVTSGNLFAQQGPDVRSMTEAQLRAYAAGIHERVLTLDTHDDIEENFATPEVDPGVNGSRQVDLPKMREGKLDVATFIVYVGQTERTPENYEKAKADAMNKFNAIHRMAEQMYPEEIEIAYTADDVERIHQSGKLVSLIAIENGYVVGKDLSLIEKYQQLGARYMTLAHNGNNDIADSANPRENLGDNGEEHGGLSPFGEEVVRELNRVGIMVDVSHISKKAAIHAARVSRAPIIASHSSVKALCDVPRNMDDEAMLALKETGGVMNIVALDSFIKKDSPEKTKAISDLRAEYGIDSPGAFRNLSAAQRAGYQQKMAAIDRQYPGPTIKDVVDHIDYAVKLIGIDHVGISSDFDGGGGISGWNNAAESGNVTLELVRRGYTEEQIGKLWSGNLLRVLREVERVAAEM